VLGEAAGQLSGQSQGGHEFDAQLQLSQLRRLTASLAAAAGLAENYAGLPISY
jgi:p-hydroxybenzoate 3-monooxygenase